MTRGLKRPHGRAIGSGVIAAALVIVGGASPATALARVTPSSQGVTADATGQHLTMWVPPGEFSTPGFNNLVKAFDSHTGNRISIVTIPLPFESTVLAKIATNVKPDLLIFHAIGNWIFSLDPTKNFLPLDGMSFIKKTSPEIIKDGDEYQGHVWAATLGFPTIDGMVYNLKDFAKAATPVPTTYAGIVRACQAIKAKEPGVAPIYVAANGTDDWTDQVFPFEMWNSALQANPAIIPDLDVNKGSFGSKPFITGFAELADLEKMGCLNPNPLSGTYALQQKAIFTGSAAMIFQLTSVIPSLVATYGEAAVNKNLGFTCVSQTDGVCSWQTTASSENVFIANTGNSATEAVARAFIQYATTTGYCSFLRQSQTYPLLSGYSRCVDKAAIPLPEQKAESLFAKSSVAQYQQQLLANYGPIQDNIQAMLDGKQTPQQVGSEMEQDFVVAAKEAGLPHF